MSKALFLLVDQIQRSMDDLNQKMLLVNNSLVQGEKTIESLSIYAGQYRENLSLSGKEPISGLAIGFGNRFEVKLRESIRKQIDQNQKFRTYLSAASQDMGELVARKKVIESLIERNKKEQELAQSRLEQKENDEFSTQAYLRKLRA